MTKDTPPIHFAFHTHGLGDVVHCATAMRLYLDRGYDVAIQVEPNKRWVWEAAGIPIWEKSDPDEPDLPLHPYYYPDMNKFFDLSTPDYLYSKVAHLLEVDMLPKLGDKKTVWEELCQVRLDATPHISPEAHAEAETFLDGLPHPIFVLHSKGTNWQAEKSIPDGIAFELIFKLLDTGGSVVILDYDARVPVVTGHPRVRSIKSVGGGGWGHIGCDRLCALLARSDLLIGVDSGPFHVASQMTSAKCLGVFRKIPPVRCCLPSPNATYLVPARDHEHWESRRPGWRFVEYPMEEVSATDIAVAAGNIVFAEETNDMPEINVQSVPGRYIYRRVGYDERNMELMPDGRIGEGAAGCERVWQVERTPGGSVLTIYGQHGGPTCHLQRDSDGVYRGFWLAHEKMPVELMASALAQCAEVIETRHDLVLIGDQLPRRERPEMALPLPVPVTDETFVVGIPTLNRYDLLHQCIDGILAGSAVPQRIYVIDNGGTWEGHPSPLVEVIRPGINLGVASSWNILHRMLQPRQLVLMNDDVVIGRNTLQAMIETPGAFITANGSQCFCVFVLRNECWRAVGQFDETFWPAYHEDNDYRMRMKLRGITDVCPSSDGYHDNGPSATKGLFTPEQMEQFNASFSACRAYYNRKWGGPPHLEKFESPFNTDMPTGFDLTVITPTWQRPKTLAMQCAQLHRQQYGSLRVEHIIVSDGPDETARGIAAKFGAKYIEHDKNMGAAGAYGRDTGIAAANGRYICFADDENVLEPTALASLYATANGFDIGIVQTLHRGNNEWRVIPESYEGEFRCGHVDLMCACVRRSVARSIKFSEEPVYDHDWRWLEKLRRDQHATVNYATTVIGIHL